MNYAMTGGGAGELTYLAIKEENHYYPFGLKHENYNVDYLEFQEMNEAVILYPPLSTSTKLMHNYKYQEQERQDELGLNWDSFKWRNYDYAIGRFMNIDPLAEKYPYNSIYAFSENRVIDGRELEGLEWESIKNDDGTTTRQLTVQMVNYSSLSDKQVDKKVTAMEADFAKTFSSTGVAARLVVEQISSSDGSCDFLVPLVDVKSNPMYNNSGEVIGYTYVGGRTAEIGQTQQNSFEITATVDGKNVSTSEMTRTFNHEAGHSAGLKHPWSLTNTVADIQQGATGVKDSTVRSNLMNSDGNPIIGNRSTSGTSLTPGQFQSMDELIKSQTTAP
jgi:RHS repeat-associated protein